MQQHTLGEHSKTMSLKFHSNGKRSEAAAALYTEDPRGCSDRWTSLTTQLDEELLFQASELSDLSDHAAATKVKKKR